MEIRQEQGAHPDGIQVLTHAASSFGSFFRLPDKRIRISSR
jgi:hypothetical protein